MGVCNLIEKWSDANQGKEESIDYPVRLEAQINAEPLPEYTEDNCAFIAVRTHRLFGCVMHLKRPSHIR
jgi:hypothetical protein